MQVSVQPFTRGAPSKNTLFMTMFYLPKTPYVIMTCVCLLPCVHFLMRLKVTGLSEWFTTLLTIKGLISCVCEHVPVKYTSAVEKLRTPYLYSFSPLWVYICFLRLPVCLNVFVQSWQIWDRSLMRTTMNYN